ncbi:MAG: M23 family metallopeptidase [Fidelibacterota bacterium]|nr:MAG: M23 family metallopeptidase [Candidatus Neomarinimicrobiota bacterium]
MGFLKRIWHKKYQFLFMAEESGWTRSFLFRGSHLSIAVLTAVLIFIVFVGGLTALIVRVADYSDLLAEKQRLRSYRNKVRHAVLQSAEYDLVGAGLLQELELAIDLQDDDGEPRSLLDERRGGIFIDQIYLNFLENVPTYPPVDGYVTRGLMLHDLDLEVNHDGIDIAAPAGEIVAAAASGLVVLSRWTEDLGYMIILSHGDGYFTIYGHNQTNLVVPRQWVDRGEPIALVGNTGISQGPHLHFEIWKDARSIDPRLLIDLYRKQDVSVETHG